MQAPAEAPPSPLIEIESDSGPRVSRLARRSTLQVLAGALGHALKLGVALALALIAWEWILGAWVFKAAPHHQDERFGWMPKPHAVGFSNIEGRGTARYNEHGFRDEPIAPRQPGELRVLCLGDSFVEALDVEREQSFEARLQEMLGKYLREQKQPGLPRTARVFNAGRSGVTVASAIYFAPRYQKLFDADLVVVMVRDEWRILFDPIEEVRYVPSPGAPDAPSAPQVAASDPFRIQMFNHWEHSGPMFRRLVKLGVRELSIVSQGQRQMRMMRGGGGGGKEGAQADAPGAGEKSDEQHQAGQNAAPEKAPGAAKPQAARAPDVLEQAAAWTPSQLRRTFPRGTSPRLLVVSVPQSASPLHNMVPISATERAFLQGCQQQQIPTVDMRPVIERDFARRQIPPFGFPTTLPWQGHFNAHGHDLVAQTLFETLRSDPALLRSRQN